MENEFGVRQHLTADKFVVAVGTRPARPDTVEFDGETIVDSDQILNTNRVPASMVVVGAGVIGIEYASMFAALGPKVTVVEKRAGMLDFCDEEIVEALKYQLRDLAVIFRFTESVRTVEKHAGGRDRAGRARQARGQRELPDLGRSHLCGRRHHRVPGAGGDVDGAWPAGVTPRAQ